MLGRFRYDPKDEIKMQSESDAVQPCKLHFGEPRIRGWVGMAVGGGHEKKRKKPERARERKKGVNSSNSSGQGKECGGEGDQLPPPRIQRCPAMSSRLSLCAGVEAQARAGFSSKVARRRARGLREACAALLQWHLHMRRACLCTCSLCSSCHTCCLLRQVLSCWSTH